MAIMGSQDNRVGCCSIKWILVLIMFLMLAACNEDSDKKRAPSTANSLAQTSTLVKAELAPFDRFPVSSAASLVWRFSAPVAPADRWAGDNFAEIVISPPLFGSWIWENDSQLSFTPEENWQPGQKISVDLSNLRLVSEKGRANIEISPKTFEIVRPQPQASIVQCDFVVTNKAPLVQKFRAKVHFNYEAELKGIGKFAKLELTSEQAGIVSSQNLDLSDSESANNGLSLEFFGPETFRPDGRLTFNFNLNPGLSFEHGAVLKSGVTCQLKVDSVTWDEIAASEVSGSKIKSLVVMDISSLQSNYTFPTDPRSPLRIRFRDPFGTSLVGHGKPKGLTLEKTFIMDPPLSGTFRSDEHNRNVIWFTPSEDWPVGREIRIGVDPQSFPDLKFKDITSLFKTAALEARFSDTSIVSDPESPGRRELVTTITFSHVPRAEDISPHLSLRLRTEPEKGFSSKNTKELKYVINQDPKLPQRFFVRTTNFALADEPGEARFLLSSGVNPEQEGGSPSAHSSSSYLAVPSKKEIFKVAMSVAVVSKGEGNLQRILTIESNEPINDQALRSSLDIFLLPDCSDKINRKLCQGRARIGDESAVLPEILDQSKQLPIAMLEHDESSSPNMFYFAFESPGQREILVKVKSSLTSDSGYGLTRDKRQVFYAEALPKRLNIMHSGALLSLSGDKRLGVVLRNIKAIEYELARILPGNMPQLIAVTSGNLATPDFDSSLVGLDQLAERFRYEEAFAERDPSKTQYTSVNFAKFIASNKRPQGLFLLTVREKGECGANKMCSQGGSCQSDEQCRIGLPEDRRLVLLTDLGILVKDSANGEHDVFVVSFKTGKPVSGVTVKLLGQNGLSVLSGQTDSQGRCTFPSTQDFKAEKAPLVYVVEKGEDLSFLPFARADRQLNFSRFDTGGIFNLEEAQGLRALIFSDRGIYRPGEQVRFGAMVRRRDMQLAGVELPLEYGIIDPRGVEIVRRKFVLSKSGISDLNWDTTGALTGSYAMSIYLISSDQKNDNRALLGRTQIRVDEFQPDRLRIKSEYVDGNESGKWAAQHGKFDVVVQNLFGTPASENLVHGTLRVMPWGGVLDGLSDYSFYSTDRKDSLPIQPEDLGELKTDENGKVSFSSDLSRFAERAFLIDFVAEAFEKDSGRSVVSSVRKLVSNAGTFVGWKADGSLNYINKGAKRTVELLAVGRNLEPTVKSGLKLEVHETRMISSLVRQPNGLLQYAMTPKSSLVWSGSVDIELTGAKIELQTTNAGSYKLKVLDEETVVATIPYMVHGEGNTTFMADRNAEVGIQLNRNSFEKGEEIEVSINTPYAGSGLLTIERDHVYSAKWFKTDTKSSVQKIKVPDGIIGNAYISVAFVRSLESKDIYTAPLSYGVKPFTISRSEYLSSINLDVPARVKPGSEFQVKYETSDPGALILYAVDEGILQFARYSTPNPIGNFVPKRALEVETYQILDLIMPDHRIVSELSSVGGDEDISLGKFKNPFARKRRAPMAFWSGVLNESRGEVSIPVPEYFNGTIRLIAVHSSDQRVGVVSREVVAQHDLVIEPQVPYFVAPSDEFELGAVIANTVQGSGSKNNISLKILTDPGLALVEPKEISLNLPAGQDASFKVKVRAEELLGEKNIRIFAESEDGKLTGQALETLSVRPAQVLRTETSIGIANPSSSGVTTENAITISRSLYAQKREVVASISYTPLSIGRSLFSYLRTYPYGCTEQVVSRAFPAIIFGSDPEFGLLAEDVNKFVSRAFQVLSSRQRADGSFGLWEITSEADPLFSVYATHFLIEAKDRGFEVPARVLERSIAWLKQISATNSYDIDRQLAQSYALYLRARLGEQVTREVKAFVSNMNRQWKDKWLFTAISPFIAGSFELLQLHEEANKFLNRPPQIWSPQFAWPLSDAGLYGAIYSWIATQHFDQSHWLSPMDIAQPLVGMFDSHQINSFNASMALLGLKAFSQGKDVSDLRIVLPDGNDAILTGKAVLNTEITAQSGKLSFIGTEPFFYQLSESGFDSGKVKSIESGLTINRELRDEKGQLKSDFSLNDKIDVTLFINAKTDLQSIAVVELLPGGVEVDLSQAGLGERKSINPGPNTWEPTFIEVQEDRIIFYGDLKADTATFTYRLKPLSRGKFLVPPAFAEGMYSPSQRFLGELGSIEIK